MTVEAIGTHATYSEYYIRDEQLPADSRRESPPVELRWERWYQVRHCECGRQREWTFDERKRRAASPAAHAGVATHWPAALQQAVAG